jgi:hypothetical protein
MTTRTVNLWAHSQPDLDILKEALRKVFGANAKTNDLGPHIPYPWQYRNMEEDTRIGYTQATQSELQNPTVRYIAKAQVEDDGTLSAKLAQVAALLPANNEKCFAFGNSINMGALKLAVIQGDAEVDAQAEVEVEVEVDAGVDTQVEVKGPSVRYG